MATSSSWRPTSTMRPFSSARMRIWRDARWARRCTDNEDGAALREPLQCFLDLCFALCAEGCGFVEQQDRRGRGEARKRAMRWRQRRKDCRRVRLPWCRSRSGARWMKSRGLRCARLLRSRRADTARPKAMLLRMVSLSSAALARTKEMEFAERGRPAHRARLGRRCARLLLVTS